MVLVLLRLAGLLALGGWKYRSAWRYCMSMLATTDIRPVMIIHLRSKIPKFGLNRSVHMISNWGAKVALLWSYAFWINKETLCQSIVTRITSEVIFELKRCWIIKNDWAIWLVESNIIKQCGHKYRASWSQSTAGLSRHGGRLATQGRTLIHRVCVREPSFSIKT